MKALLCTALLLISSAGHANRSETATSQHACDSQSPSLLQLGERYYYLAPNPTSVTAQEMASLEKLYARLEGRWKGQWTDQHCTGTGKTARLKTKKRQFRQVQAAVREHGQLSLRADGLSIDLPSGKELISLEILDSNTLTMSLRYQRGTEEREDEPRPAALRERHDTLSLSGRNLRVETRWFINGFYSGTEVTTLHKVR